MLNYRNSPSVNCYCHPHVLSTALGRRTCYCARSPAGGRPETCPSGLRGARDTEETRSPREKHGSPGHLGARPSQSARVRGFCHQCPPNLGSRTRGQQQGFSESIGVFRVGTGARGPLGRTRTRVWERKPGWHPEEASLAVGWEERQEGRGLQRWLSLGPLLGPSGLPFLVPKMETVPPAS